MSTNTERMVERFLRQESCNKQIAAYVLRHASKGRTGNEIETFDIIERLESEQLKALAVMIVERAQLDADGFGPTPQRYTLTSYFSGDEDGKLGKSSGRITFRMKGVADMDLDGDDEAGEEAPNMRGIVQQLMRHNEANNRTLIGSLGTMLSGMNRQMENMARMNEKLLEDKFRNIEIMERAMSEQHDRDLQRYEVEQKNQRVMFGFQKISMLIPLLMDKLSGGKLPSKTDPTMLMLGELIGSMNHQQLEQIRTSLQPEQQMVFLTLLKKFSEQPKLPNGAPDSGTTKEN